MFSLGLLLVDTVFTFLGFYWIILRILCLANLPYFKIFQEVNMNLFLWNGMTLSPWMNSFAQNFFRSVFVFFFLQVVNLPKINRSLKLLHIQPAEMLSNSIRCASLLWILHNILFSSQNLITYSNEKHREDAIICSYDRAIMYAILRQVVVEIFFN